MFFPKKQQISVVQMHGIISTKEDAINAASIEPLLIEAFKKLDGPNDHVILDINSPGGSPVQSAVVSDLIRHHADRTGATVSAVIQDAGASGGYWIACAADKIYASPMSLVGSIGVIMSSFGFATLLAKHGVERRIYTAGRNKSRLDPFKEARPEDIEFIKPKLETLHSEFKAWVMQRRGKAIEAAATQTGNPDIFDGSFWTGREALGLGLVDGLSDLPKTIRALSAKKVDVRKIKRKKKLLSRIPFLGASADTEAFAESFASAVAKHVEARLGTLNVPRLD